MRRPDSVERLQSLQNAILESIARGEELAAIMTVLCERVEALAPGVVCSVVTIDEDFRLRPLAAPSLPQAYGEAVNGIAIGPHVGSCGTAIYRKSPVEVTDIATDPHWEGYRDLVLPLGLRACWSSPIAARDGRVVGSFAVYYRDPRGPTAFERRIVETCVHLCAIAIEHEEVKTRNHRLAYFDTLTGLPNRARFNEAIGQATRRTSSRFGLILIDIDHLKAVNDTIGINGLVPSLLVFGIIPRFPIIASELPKQEERMKVLAEARAEYEAIVAELRITAAMKHAVPEAASRVYAEGDKVLVFRERDKEWCGPLTVVDTADKIVTVKSDTGSPQQFNKVNVKPYFDSEEEEATEMLYQMLSPFRSKPGKKKTTPKVYMTEVIKNGDPRAKLFDEAKAKEIKGLIDRGTWKVVSTHDLPQDANIMGGRFVLAIKNEGTKDEVYKARYVVQGYRDKMKTSLVHDSATSRQISTRILVGLAAIFGFRLFSTDVTQAYLQSSSDLMREVYIKPGKEFNLRPNEILKLLRPLYGLADSGDYWGATFSKHITEDLGMRSCVGDSAMFYRSEDGELVGLTATYVDDALQAGTPEFLELVKATERKFECKPREYDSTSFVGKEIEKTDYGFAISQRKYIASLKFLEVKKEDRDKPPNQMEVKAFKSLRAKLLWAQNSRPDVSCAVAKLTQVTDDDLGKDKLTWMRMANRVVKHLKANDDVLLMYPKLDPSSLRMRVYTDASYADNKDGSSQLGYAIYLCDGSGKAQLIAWSSHKSRRVTRSVLGSETMALADGFDAGYAIRHDLERMTRRKIPISMFTDSLSLFDVVTKATITTERRLMIDIAGVKQAYKAKEIHTLGFIRTNYNVADALTKVKACDAMRKTLRTGKLEHPIEQWVERKDDEDDAPKSSQPDEEGKAQRRPESPVKDSSNAQRAMIGHTSEPKHRKLRPAMMATQFLQGDDERKGNVEKMGHIRGSQL